MTLADPAVQEAADVATALGADLENGLTGQQAQHRLAQNGPNELAATPRVAAWRRMLSQFQDPLIYLLLGAIAISLAAWVFEGLHGWPVDAIVIALIVILNGVLGHVQEAKAHDAVAALARMVPSAELVRGDLLVLGEGDAVGADARLVRPQRCVCRKLAHRRERSGAEGRGHPAASAAVLAIVTTWCSRARRWRRAPAWRWSPPPAWPPRWAPSRTCWKPRRSADPAAKGNPPGSAACWAWR
jgi:hypothetical protein